MPQRDIRNDVIPVLLFNAAIISNTNTDSTELDTADYDGGVKFDIFATAYSDGDYAVEIHVSDTTGFTPDSTTLLSGDSLIPASSVPSIGAVLAAGATPDSIGFISAKRYAVVRLVSTGTSSGATLLVLTQANPEIKPGI